MSRQLQHGIGARVLGFSARWFARRNGLTHRGRDASTASTVHLPPAATVGLLSATAATGSTVGRQHVGNTSAFLKCASDAGSAPCLTPVAENEDIGYRSQVEQCRRGRCPRWVPEHSPLRESFSSRLKDPCFGAPPSVKGRSVNCATFALRRQNTDRTVSAATETATRPSTAAVTTRPIGPMAFSPITASRPRRRMKGSKTKSRTALRVWERKRKRIGNQRSARDQDQRCGYDHHDAIMTASKCHSPGVRSGSA